VESVAGKLRHRGPDDGGFLTLAEGRNIEASRIWSVPQSAAQAVLIHRRLALLDTRDDGWQPMQSADGRYAIVLDGEVYNRELLRHELAQQGYRFRSSSDAEVLLAAFATWRESAPRRLVGMYAFAILDIVERKLFVCRDHFGLKPLYHATNGNAFYFASEIPALLEFVPTYRNVRPGPLYRYLRRGITDAGSDTLFSGINQLLAASYAVIDIDHPGKFDHVQYWEPSIETRTDISFDEAASELQRLFLEGIALQTPTGVPVGCTLSGGTDSSAIACAMRSLFPSAELHALSYVPSDRALSEERWTDVVGVQASLEVHKVEADEEDLVRAIDLLTVRQGEPFRSTSIFAQYCLFREAASQNVKVVLDGHGADTLLGGHPYLGVRLAELIRHGQVSRAINFLRACAQHPGNSGSYLAQKAAEYLLPLGIQGPLRRLVGRDLVPRWMNASWFRAAGVTGGFYGDGTPQPFLKKGVVHELRADFPCDLRYGERNSMAWSVEIRTPFLMPALANFMLSLPESYIIGDDGTVKRVFVAAMRGIVPDAILDRRDKVAFTTPEVKWIGRLDRWIRQVISGAVAHNIPALKIDQVKGLWEETAAGRRRSGEELWRVLNLIRWSEQFNARYS
jgi:asparagine synthase (glutamine-hydrolysing)